MSADTGYGCCRPPRHCCHRSCFHCSTRRCAVRRVDCRTPSRSIPWLIRVHIIIQHPWEGRPCDRYFACANLIQLPRPRNVSSCPRECQTFSVVSQMPVSLVWDSHSHVEPRYTCSPTTCAGSHHTRRVVSHTPGISLITHVSLRMRFARCIIEWVQNRLSWLHPQVTLPGLL